MLISHIPHYYTTSEVVYSPDREWLNFSVWTFEYSTKNLILYPSLTIWSQLISGYDCDSSLLRNQFLLTTSDVLIPTIYLDTFLRITSCITLVV